MPIKKKIIFGKQKVQNRENHRQKIDLNTKKNARTFTFKEENNFKKKKFTK